MRDDDVQLLMEFSGPRAGTSNFARLLAGHSNVLSYGEMFNHNNTFTAEGADWYLKAAKDLGVNVDPVDLEARKQLNASPLDAIRVAVRHAALMGKELLHFKVSYWNFEFLKLHDVVRSVRPFGLIQYRSPIDTYISLEKARNVAKYQSVDTTSIKPRIEAKAFLAFRRQQQIHYQLGRHYLKRYRLPFVYLSYEETYGTDADPLHVIQDRMKELGLKLGEFDGAARQMRRQDREEDRTKKVENWDAFLRDLKELDDLSTLDAYDMNGSLSRISAKLFVEQKLPRGVGDRVKGIAKAVFGAGIGKRHHG